MKQNITLSVDKDVIKKAKVISSRKMTSISQLLSNEISRIVEEDERYDHSRRVALALLEKGYHLGGEIKATREELHER
jgi:hypothetical protein